MSEIKSSDTSAIKISLKEKREFQTELSEILENATEDVFHGRIAPMHNTFDLLRSKLQK